MLAQQQINVVKTQIAARQRDIRIFQLTAGELSTVPQDTKVYEGVGKMYAGVLHLDMPLTHLISMDIGSCLVPLTRSTRGSHPKLPR